MPRHRGAIDVVVCIPPVLDYWLLPNLTRRVGAPVRNAARFQPVSTSNPKKKKKTKKKDSVAAVSPAAINPVRPSASRQYLAHFR